MTMDIVAASAVRTARVVEGRFFSSQVHNFMERSFSVELALADRQAHQTTVSTKEISICDIN